MLPLMVWTLGLGCSDPAYYPNIDETYAPGTYGLGDSGLDIEDVPCSADPLGADDTISVLNGLDEVVIAKVKTASCLLEDRFQVPAGQSGSIPTFIGEVWLFTDTGGTRLYAWTTSAEGDEDAVVIP